MSETGESADLTGAVSAGEWPCQPHLCALHTEYNVKSKTDVQHLDTMTKSVQRHGRWQEEMWDSMKGGHRESFLLLRILS